MNKNKFNEQNEQDRLNALLNYEILDTPAEEDFDSITKLVSYICGTPIALISLIDDKRQWFKSKIGVDAEETPVDIAFCKHAIEDDIIFEIENALDDDRFKNNPLVTGPPEIRFYAGAPLKSSSGHNIGTLCVIDRTAKKLTPEQKEGLDTLGKQVIAQLELREKNRNLKDEIQKLADENFEKVEIQKILENKNDELEKYNYEIKAANTFFSMSSDLLFVADKEYFLKVNPAFSSMLGFDEKYLLETPFMQFVHPEDHENSMNELITIANGIPTINFESRFRKKDGNYLWMDWSITPDVHTDIRYGIGYDITNRKKNENDLIQAKELAERLSIIKDQFIANMSHEIRTPLNAIIGFTELLTQTSPTSIQLDYIDNVQNAGENLLLIINDILDISKIESGKLVLDLKPFNLQKTLKQVYNLLRDKSNLAVNFSLFLDASLPETVLGDYVRLNQILINLAGKALKFTKDGSVSIFVKKVKESAEDYSIHFTVKDTGIGIPENKLDKIFERFTQAEDSTTRRFGGTGLGLNIVKQLIDLHKGEISVSSKLEVGSEFNVVLNYKKSIKIAATTQDLGLGHNLEGLKILLCEDNVLNQKLTETVVLNFGFKLDIAQNGQEGIECVVQNNYDLILMDLQMPIKDCYQATQYIRNELKMNIPIIAMTADSLLGIEQRCFEIGMNGYVAKPFKQTELLEAIIKAVKENAQSAPNFDFSLIDELSIGNELFKHEMITLFIENVPSEVKSLEKSVREDDFKTVSQKIHKIKPSLEVFKLDDALSNLIAIEKDAHFENFTLATLQNIRTFVDKINIIVSTLKKIVDKP